MKIADFTQSYRWQVASRVVAATVGGYAFASALMVLLALLWPLPPAQAVLASMMLGFVWYTIAIIYAFTVRTAKRAWMGLLISTAVISLLCWALLPAVPGGAV